MCILSKSFKHPLSVCAILTSQDRWYLHTTETMEPFVLQAGLSRGDSSLPQLAPNRAFVSNDWISEPLEKDTVLLLKPYFPLSKLTQPFSSHRLQNERQKYTGIHIQAMYIVFSKCKLTQRKDLQKKVLLEIAGCPHYSIKNTDNKLLFSPGVSQCKHLVICFPHVLGALDRLSSKDHFCSHIFLWSSH